MWWIVLGVAAVVAFLIWRTVAIVVAIVDAIMRAD